MANVGANRNDVLVCGDWYVDAHWVVAPHQSGTASRPGAQQSLAVHEVDATVRVLCGAGQVANILTAAISTDPARILGLGSWAIEDDGFIQALMKGQNIHDNPLKLKSFILEESMTSGRQVFNLSTDARSGTNRVIRIYRKTSATEYSLVERIDFEAKARNALAVPPLPTTIGTVVIKDHGHGVVTPELIQAIKNQCENPDWYVCTKVWPDKARADVNQMWISALRDQRIRLLMLQHEAAAKAVTDDPMFPDVGNWFVGENVPTRNAIRAIDRVAEFLSDSEEHRPTIVVLPSRESLIARVPGKTKDDTQGFSYLAAPEKATEKFVPRASALFASLAATTRGTGRCPDVSQIGRALRFTSTWVKHEAKRLTDRAWERNPVLLDTSQDSMVKIVGSGPSESDSGESKPKKRTEFLWSFVRREHEHAFSGRPTDGSTGHGLISREAQPPSLELWRARSDVPGVISIIRPKRHMLRQLAQEIDQFVRSGRKRHQAYMLVDDPGGGKSTLVRQLAEGGSLRVLPVNITELTRRTDLLAFFDTIVTTQAQDPSVGLLVFVDEINALLEGHTVYSSFLAPLEDGHYNRDGRSFTIQPCVWVFVGTDDLDRDVKSPGRTASRSLQRHKAYVDAAIAGSPKPHKRKRSPRTPSEERSQLDRSQKKSDFLSRLAAPPFMLNQPLPYLDEGVGQIHDELQKETEALLKDIADAFESNEADDSPELIARKLIGSHLLRRGRALERIYIGASLITSLHPDVEKISLRVIKAFGALPDRFTYRDLRHDLEKMVDVQKSRVVWANLPSRLRNRQGVPWLDVDIRKLLDGPITRPLGDLCPAADDQVLVDVRGELQDDQLGWTGIP